MSISSFVVCIMLIQQWYVWIVVFVFALFLLSKSHSVTHYAMVMARWFSFLYFCNKSFHCFRWKGLFSYPKYSERWRNTTKTGGSGRKRRCCIIRFVSSWKLQNNCNQLSQRDWMTHYKCCTTVWKIEFETVVVRSWASLKVSENKAHFHPPSLTFANFGNWTDRIGIDRLKRHALQNCHHFLVHSIEQS